MKSNIKNKIKQGKRLSKTEVQYIKQNILPQYEVGCKLCKFNLAMYFNLILD